MDTERTTFVKIEGDKTGYPVYVLENKFIYHFIYQSSGIDYFRCREYRERAVLCHGRVRCAAGTLNVLSVTPHSHGERSQQVKKLQFKNELRRTCRENWVASLRQIYDSVASNERFRETAPLVGFPAVISMMRRIRKSTTPPVPHDLRQYAAILSEDRWKHLGRTLAGEPFYRCIIQSTDGTDIVILASNKLCNMMQSSTRIHMDATFKTVPRELHAYQLLTIHATYLNHVFPAVFALMERKSQAAYITVLDYIKDTLAPNLSPEMIMTDFEDAMRGAVETVYPGTWRGCFFHYAQAVFKRHTKLRLKNLTRQNEDARCCLKMLMAIALLPSEYIIEGLRSIEDLLRAVHLEEAFQALIEYMWSQWINHIGPNNLSVFNLPRRTNNDLENYHLQLLRQVGRRPGVWTFTRLLIQNEQVKVMDFQTLQNGREITRCQRRQARRNQLNLERRGQELIAKAISVMEYLQSVSHTIDSLDRNFGELIEEPPTPDINNGHEVLPGIYANDSEVMALNEPVVARGTLLLQPQEDLQYVEEVHHEEIVGDETVQDPQVDTESPIRQLPHNTAPGRVLCCVCLQTVVTMIALNCGHTLCEGCVRGLQEVGRDLSCPTCRTPIIYRTPLFLCYE